MAIQVPLSIDGVLEGLASSSFEFALLTPSFVEVVVSLLLSVDGTSFALFIPFLSLTFSLSEITVSLRFSEGGSVLVSGVSLMITLRE